jgi:hypothetical protein
MIQFILSANLSVLHASALSFSFFLFDCKLSTIDCRLLFEVKWI